MLTQLTIKNYALIDELQVSFSNGLTIITGETGAGKSILLGGLSLILGKRAEITSVKDSSKKCVIEGVFRGWRPRSIFRTPIFNVALVGCLRQYASWRLSVVCMACSPCPTARHITKLALLAPESLL